MKAAAQRPMQKIPVTVLPTDLGLGKAALFDHLVRQQEFADTVIIFYEFGEMVRDHLPAAHYTEELVMEMSSGCPCCAIRGAQVKPFLAISWRFSLSGQGQVKRVRIETTGLTDLAPIIHVLMTHQKMMSKYWLEEIVTTVDMVTDKHTLDGHPKSVKQAADALQLIEVKLALIERCYVVLRRLHSINPSAPRWEVGGGEIAPQKVQYLGLISAKEEISDVPPGLRGEAYDGTYEHTYIRGYSHDPVHDHHDANRLGDRIQVFRLHVDESVPDATLANWHELIMAFVRSNILRVKGVLKLEGEERPIGAHGKSHVLHPPVLLPTRQRDDHRWRLIFVTLDGAKELVERTFDALGLELPQVWMRAV
nr:GTP-binding protein [Comamonas koreensis]